MTVRLMVRDPNNPLDFTVDSGYPFDGSEYVPTMVGEYSYQAKMFFDQSDNVETITFVNSDPLGYYDNSGNWHRTSSTQGTINISELGDFDYSRGLTFGQRMRITYTTSQPASTPIPKIGSDDISKIYLGTEEISKIYLGNEVVYEAEVEPPVVDIGNAYYISNGTEVANNTLFSEEVSLLKQPPSYEGLIDNWDSTKSFKISLKNVIINNHNSFHPIILPRLKADGIVRIGIDTDGYFKFYCSYGNSPINSNIIAFTDGTAYDVELEYDGINSVMGKAKLSSSNIWNTQTCLSTITSTPTDYTSIVVGATNTMININDVYVENDNVVRFQR